MSLTAAVAVLALAVWIATLASTLKSLNGRRETSVVCHAKDFRRTKHDVSWTEVRYLVCNFSGMQLARLRCNLSIINDSNFYQANLSEAYVTGSFLSRCNFNQARLGGARFDNCTLSGSSFFGAGCEKASFRSANLANTKFVGANLRGAELGHASLVDANLRFCDLRDADLYFADLTGCDLYGADLTGCRVSSFDLRGVKNAHMAYGIHDRLARVMDSPLHMVRVEHLMLPAWDDDLEELFRSRGCDLDIARHLFYKQRQNVSLVEIIDTVVRLCRT
jgi:uncharacterized protein YjbI with pentapeptide repeats